MNSRHFDGRREELRLMGTNSRWNLGVLLVVVLVIGYEMWRVFF